jgi:demethylmenaquinone methyltransferase/2-methoxy-6-polyprenyl-1,4-benzoquinol methylase
VLGSFQVAFSREQKQKIYVQHLLSQPDNAAQLVADLDAGLREVHRVLKPGARFVILEFSTPPLAIVRTFYHLYFHHVLPLVGRLVSGHGSAYTYLPMSVSHFPTEETLASHMRRAGFTTVTWERLTFGIAAIHVGTA